MVRSRGNGRRPACHSIGDGYVQGRTSGKILKNNPKLAKWTLDGLFGKHKKQAPFLRKQRIISQPCAGQGRKLVRQLVY